MLALRKRPSLLFSTTASFAVRVCVCGDNLLKRCSGFFSASCLVCECVGSRIPVFWTWTRTWTRGRWRKNRNNKSGDWDLTWLPHKNSFVPGNTLPWIAVWYFVSNEQFVMFCKLQLSEILLIICPGSLCCDSQVGFFAGVNLSVCEKHEYNTEVPRPARPAEAVLCGCHPAGEQHWGSEEQTEDDLQVTHHSIAHLSEIFHQYGCFSATTLFAKRHSFSLCVSAGSWCCYTPMFWPVQGWTPLTIFKLSWL